MKKQSIEVFTSYKLDNLSSIKGGSAVELDRNSLYEKGDDIVDFTPIR